MLYPLFRYCTNKSTSAKDAIAIRTYPTIETTLEFLAINSLTDFKAFANESAFTFGTVILVTALASTTFGVATFVTVFVEVLIPAFFFSINKTFELRYIL